MSSRRKIENRNHTKSPSSHMLHLRNAKKHVSRYLPWLDEALQTEDQVFDLNPSPDIPHFHSPQKLANERYPCPYCRGTRKLCGKPQCPILIRFFGLVKTHTALTEPMVIGNSPPGLFIGRYGYPYVQGGPLIPPTLECTSHFDSPEAWYGNNSFEEILNFRASLIRGKHRLHIKNANDKHQNSVPGRMVYQLQELAVADSQVYSEMVLTRQPQPEINMQMLTKPMGPSAPMSRFSLSGIKSNQRLEKAWYDRDLLTSDAIMGLHKNQVSISSIQKAFSVGCFGRRLKRKLVPTRWSITATDSVLSNNLISKIKSNPLFSEIELHESTFLGNRFIVILLPTSWRFEFIEVFFPGSAWNPGSTTAAICSDYEYYKGRTKYARIGGCYYASRFGVAEYLTKERRQAGVLILREAYPSYLLPIGVWLVREAVRAALKQPSKRFSSLTETLAHIETRLKLRKETWMQASQLLLDAYSQSTLDEFWRESHIV